MLFEACGGGGDDIDVRLVLLSIVRSAFLSSSLGCEFVVIPIDLIHKWR